MAFFDSASITENEANLFSAELLLTDKDVLTQLTENAFFQATQALYVPAALLDHKFRVMCKVCHSDPPTDDHTSGSVT